MHRDRFADSWQKIKERIFIDQRRICVSSFSSFLFRTLHSALILSCLSQSPGFTNGYPCRCGMFTHCKRVINFPIMLVVILDVNVHIFVVFYLMGLGTGNWDCMPQCLTGFSNRGETFDGVDNVEHTHTMYISRSHRMLMALYRWPSIFICELSEQEPHSICHL